jgi:ABC-type sugar transport system ATPase subunit
MPENYSIRFQNISKRFPGVLAVDMVNLAISSGSCHALIGENGAGKSTLGNILAGICQPDEGRIFINEKPVTIHNPIDALKAGIAMVHQELSFCENMTVAENLCLGRMPARATLLSKREMLRMAREMLSAIKMEIDLTSQMGALPIGMQQMVQIASAVARGAHILVFDEPTSSLSEVESRNLFTLIRLLKKRGVTQIYISHRLEEIFELCDALTVLRDGQVIATSPVSGVNNESLVEMMIGRKVEAFFAKTQPLTCGRELMRVENISSRAGFSRISFSLHAGEIVGLAGLVGSGRTEISRALFGLDPDVKGDIFIDNRKVFIKRPCDAMKLGMGLVPEDRKHHGLVLMMKAKDNITLPLLKRLSRWGWIKAKDEESLSREYFNLLRIRAGSMNDTVESLSGGNQQKVVIARWLSSKCNILILDEPTRGIDVGAKAEIHSLIYDLAAKGCGIILISSELPEILNLSTRIIVLRQGTIAGALNSSDATQETLLRRMTGIC